jgi:lysophospholipase L1-like esterase
VLSVQFILSQIGEVMVRPAKVTLGVWLVWLSVASVTWGQGGFYLRDGDRVVFYGDSITEQRLYTTFTETYIVTRFPQLNVSFVHSGVDGDRVTGGWAGPIDLRLYRDVFAYQPTVVTIMLGMNDGNYRAFDADVFETYCTGYQYLVDSVQAALPGVRLTLIQPSPYDDVTRPVDFEGGYNAVLVRYGQFVKELAQTQRCDAADLNTSVVAALAKAKATDPETAKKIFPDRVHPDPGGHLLLAQALLQAWNAPAVVSAVGIDATRFLILRQEKTVISGLQEANGLAWMQKDEALPMPLDLQEPVMKLAVQSSDFLAALDWQPLQVTGLNGQRYLLKIDGKEVGTFSRAQLGAGINLAQFTTPMVEQAQAVHDLTLKHNNVHSARWRELQVALAHDSLPHLPQALEALDNVEADLVAQQRLMAQPRTRRYELLRQE